jgi:sugar phosphate isomerase/epimerase
MVLTLEAGSFAGVLAGASSARGGGMQLPELPGVASAELDLRGLSVPAALLAGRSVAELETLRHAADKAGCPCLMLTESRVLDLRGDDAEAGLERLVRLGGAAAKLGCSALAIPCGLGDDEDPDEVAAAIRRGVLAIERFELNLLIVPAATGPLSEPLGVTDLIRRVGGFRIGCMPSFGHALSTRDPEATLRKLAPYAGAIQADLDDLGLGRSHESKAGRVLLGAFVAALRAVGYGHTLALSTRLADPRARLAKTGAFLQAQLSAAPEPEDAA